jgi:hypothetical protein
VCDSLHATRGRRDAGAARDSTSGARSR